MSLDYVTLDELKATLGLLATDYADTDLQRAATSASRELEKALDRRFWADDNNTGERLYTPDRYLTLDIDDLIELKDSTIELDLDGDGVYEQTWTLGTEFIFAPANAAAKDAPYERLIVKQRHSGFGSSHRRLPLGMPDSVRVTGQFGWPEVPEPIKQATIIVAGKLLRRSRESPFPILSLANAGGVSQRLIPGDDPELLMALRDYSRETYVA